MERSKWVDWAVELQSIGQAGLHYSKDDFDAERYQRIRDIAAEMIACQSDEPLGRIKELFCCERAYQTPKLECRAAVFSGEKILLVQERDGKWSLPGGFVDVGLSPGEAAVREVREEAGLEVTADRIIAVQDRDRHNSPLYLYRICRVYVLCTVVGGEFAENIETSASGYFALDGLPPLSTARVVEEQIKMCFDAYHSEHWEVVFD